MVEVALRGVCLWLSSGRGAAAAWGGGEVLVGVDASVVFAVLAGDLACGVVVLHGTSLI